MRRELDDEERQKYRSQKSGSKDFSMCFDNLQVDSKQDSDIPHLNKTTSIVVNEAFKAKNQARAHPK